MIGRRTIACVFALLLSGAPWTSAMAQRPNGRPFQVIQEQIEGLEARIGEVVQSQGLSGMVFPYTGSEQTFTVPADAQMAWVEAWGGGGGGGCGAGRRR